MCVTHFTHVLARETVVRNISVDVTPEGKQSEGLVSVGSICEWFTVCSYVT